jgi:hypothetical protein
MRKQFELAFEMEGLVFGYKHDTNLGRIAFACAPSEMAALGLYYHQLSPPKWHASGKPKFVASKAIAINA